MLNHVAFRHYMGIHTKESKIDLKVRAKEVNMEWAVLPTFHVKINLPKPAFLSNQPPGVLLVGKVLEVGTR